MGSFLFGCGILFLGSIFYERKSVSKIEETVRKFVSYVQEPLKIFPSLGDIFWGKEEFWIAALQSLSFHWRRSKRSNQEVTQLRQVDMDKNLIAFCFNFFVENSNRFWICSHSSLRIASGASRNSVALFWFFTSGKRKSLTYFTNWNVDTFDSKKHPKR